MRRPRAATAAIIAALAALAACSGSKDGGGATGGGAAMAGGAAAGGKALGREEFTRVEVESVCAMLQAGVGLNELDEHRDRVLEAMGRSRAEFLRAAQAFRDDPLLREQVERGAAACRRAAGYVEDGTGPNGETIWRKSGP